MRGVEGEGGVWMGVLERGLGGYLVLGRGLGRGFEEGGEGRARGGKTYALDAG